MNFSTKTKNEITKRDYKDCCRLSLLAALIRTNGNLLSHNGVYGFSISCDNNIVKFVCKLIKNAYGETPEVFEIGNSKNRSICQMISSQSHKLMVDCKILEEREEGVFIKFSPDSVLKQSQCCKIAFVCGAFLGAGSVTVPKINTKSSTNYHLEFDISNPGIKDVIISIFVELGFMPKVIMRNNSHVIYFNNAENVNDIITLFGATKSSLELTDIIVYKELKNNLNRFQNCEMSNMSKAIDAAIMDKKAIEQIDQIIGINSLIEGLQVVARARLNSGDKPLSQLAEELGITKSCLSHRLRKLREIASNLSE